LRLLLDTHALLWWLADDARLGLRARELIGDPTNDVLVSVGSLWEIVVKMRIGKLDADLAEIIRAIEQGGFSLLGIEAAHLARLATLPSHHRDPFDHLLLAQAAAEAASLVSDDANMRRYGASIITRADPRP
jgi:PIN domain nuclease of toxin-antitoxin system